MSERYADVSDPDDPTWVYFDSLPRLERLSLVDASGYPMYTAYGERYPYALVPVREQAPPDAREDRPL